jgi:hypothetical protein
LWVFETGEEILGFVIADRRHDDDVFALLPVGGSRDAVLGRELHRVDDPQYLLEVPPGGHGIDQDELDQLVRPDDEDVSHRRVVGRRPTLRAARRVGRQHAVELGDLEVGIGEDREVGRGPLRLGDIGRPPGMVVGRID